DPAAVRHRGRSARRTRLSAGWRDRGHLRALQPAHHGPSLWGMAGVQALAEGIDTGRAPLEAGSIARRTRPHRDSETLQGRPGWSGGPVAPWRDWGPQEVDAAIMQLPAVSCDRGS